MHVVFPADAYVPLPQVTHAVLESESTSASPALHSVHDVAPEAPSELVTAPAPQVTHSTVDTLLYLPGVHAEHAVEELRSSVFVTDPDAQTAHPTVDTLLYCPAPHAVQLVAPA